MTEIIAGGGAIGAQIEVRGFAETLLALSAVDEDLRKRFTTELKTVGKTVAGMAANTSPHRSGTMATGYKSRMRSKRLLTKVTVSNATAQGNILEFAGSTTRGKTKQGRALIQSLDAKYGKTGRFMWDAYDTLEPWIKDTVERAVEDAEASLQSAIRKADA